MQDRTRRPSIWTVHAPHSPRSHDFLGPVKANSSRNASSSVVRGSTVIARTEPLTIMLTRMCMFTCPRPAWISAMVCPFLFEFPEQLSEFHNLQPGSTGLRTLSKGSTASLRCKFCLVTFRPLRRWQHHPPGFSFQDVTRRRLTLPTSNALVS